MAPISSCTVRSLRAFGSVLAVLGALALTPACTFLDTSPLPDAGAPDCADPGLVFDADCAPDLGRDTGAPTDTWDVADAPDTGAPPDTRAPDAEDAKSDPDTSTPDVDASVPAPTTDEIFDTVFSTSCASHHTTGTRVPSLAREGLEERLLLSSLQVPTMAYVTPGDPDASYLFHKVTGTHLDVGGTGLRMPANRPPLSAEAIDSIEAWILGLETAEPPETEEASTR